MQNAQHKEKIKFLEIYLKKYLKLELKYPLREVGLRHGARRLHPLRHFVTPLQKGEAGFCLAPAQGELVAERQPERA